MTSSPHPRHGATRVTADTAIRRAVHRLILGRLVVGFASGLSTLGFTVIAIQELGGVHAGVIVAAAIAIGGLLGNIVGSLADFWSPVRVMLVLAGAAAAAAALPFATVLLGVTTLPLFAASSGVLALCATGISRADTTAFVQMLPEDELPRVFGLIAVRGQIASSLAGLCAGATLIAWAPLPFLVVTLAWLLFIPVTLAFGRTYTRVVDVQITRPELGLAPLLTGFSFALSHRGIAAILLISAASNLFLGGFGAVIEIDLLAAGTSPVLVGLLETFTSLAALLGSIVSGPLSARLSVRSLFVLVNSVMGTAIIACSLTQTYAVVAASLSVAVFFIPSLGVAAAASIARMTPMSMQARVSGASSIISLSLAAVSPGLYGFAYVRMSRLVLFAGTGAVILVLAVVSRFTVPVLGAGRAAAGSAPISPPAPS